ncbi:MAG: RidA family protein [Polyangiaceae bacterium]|nr:RidA family protein [Polyangiaceae bacterium]
MSHVTINPESLGAPKGYSNGMLTPAGGRVLFVAGQVAWNEKQQVVSEDFAEQFGQALRNVVTVVRAAGGAPEHVGRMTIFVTSKDEYAAAAKQVGAEYRELMGRHFPAMTLVEIKALLEEGAKVEIEATAVLPA